jgi:hypothetical protein
MNDFEQDLQDDLHRILDPMTAGPIPARRAMQPGGSMKKLLGGAGAALGVKILTGFAVAAMAATAAVAATEVAITGSVNPANWGQQVTTQVNACKASAARLGVHGIGQCVSQFAEQHGDAVSAAPGNGNSNNAGNGNGNSNNAGNGNGHGNSNNAGNGNGHGNGNGNGKNKSQGSASGTASASEPIVPVRSPIPPQP